MTQGERVKEVRKVLGLTLDKFGEKLGVGKSAISNIEKGNRNLTDQMAKSICREYRVNYQWLSTGEGEMFLENDDMELQEMIDRILVGENEFHKKLFRVLAKMTDEELAHLKQIIDSLADNKKD